MPKRRLNGEGSYLQRSDGTYRCQISVKDGMGKTIRKSLYAKTLPECQKKVKAFQKEMEGKTIADINRGKMTLGEWGDEHIKDCEIRVENSNKFRQSSLVKYERYLRVYIKAYSIGDVKLCKLTPSNIDAFHKALGERERKLSSHMFRDISAFLNLLLKKAVREEVIPSNPYDKCKKSLIPGKEDSPESREMNDEQIVSFLEVIKGKEDEALFRFALFEGMRISEILGLTWDCWNPNRETLKIYEQLLYDSKKKEYVFSPLKTKKSRRILALPASITHLLEEQKKRQAEQRLKAGPLWNNSDNLIFTNDFGGHLCHNTVRKHIKDIYTEIGTPESRFHDLRHAFAALSWESGDGTKDIQDNLGHSSAKTSLDIYTYRNETAKRASANRLEKTIQRLDQIGEMG